MNPESSGLAGGVGRRLEMEADGLDRAVYNAVASTPTPTLDGPITWISNAANLSRMWIVIATALAVADSHRGRQAAIRGLTAVGAASITANMAAKHIFPRHRPTRSTPTGERQAHMPTSNSFPSGHTASAFAFSTAATGDLPGLSLPLYGLASAVGYSRVHTGVHYPSDVIAGAVLGLTVGTLVREATRRIPRRPRSGFSRRGTSRSTGRSGRRGS